MRINHPDAAARIEQGRRVARDNAIAAAIVERAAATRARDRDALERCAVAFERLGCRYQQTRCGTIAAQLSASSPP